MRALSASALLAVFAASAVASPRTSTSSYVAVGNTASPGGLTPIAAEYGDGPLTTATATRDFTGLDASGGARTMTFSAVTRNASEYGALHAYSEAHLTDSYYNPANPVYADGHGGVADPNGSPDNVASLGFSFFDDTLQYGGVALAGGYEARYVFHIEGTNAGDLGDYGLSAASAGLAVNVGSESDGVGFYDATVNRDYATKGFAVDGQTPQDLDVQFSTQVVFNTYQYADGSDLNGTAQFTDTAILAGIALYDPRTGAYVPTALWSVTSASGTRYARLNSAPVPEPASLVALAMGTLVAARRGKR